MKPALTVKQLAELLNVNDRTVYRMAQAGWIPAFKVSGSWRFLDEDIRRWIGVQKEAVGEAVGKHAKPTDGEGVTRNAMMPPPRRCRWSVR